MFLRSFVKVVISLSLVKQPIYDVSKFVSTIPTFMDQMEIVTPFDYKQLAHIYCDKIISTSFNPFDLVDDDGEHYSYEIKLFAGYYTPFWSIQKLKNLARESNAVTLQFSVKELFSTITNKDITITNGNENDSNEPVIIGEMPFLRPSCVLLDGNHRVAYRFGKKFNLVYGHLLPFPLHIQAVTSKFMKVFLSVQYNMYLIFLYMMGEMDCSDFTSSLLLV